MQAGQTMWRPRAALCAALILAGSLAYAQTAVQTGQFEPKVGQAGKDVVWVPTPQELVDKMLDMAKVTPQDFVMDLGSGDGRTVITAAKRGARAKGIEYNPDMVALSQRNATAQNLGDRAAFVQGGPVRDRLLAGDRHHHVPAAGHQPEAAAEDPRPQARHSGRVQHVHDGGVGSRRDLRGSPTARAGARPCCGSCRPRSPAPGRSRRASWR